MTGMDPDTGFDEEALSELEEDMGDAMPAFVTGFLAAVDEGLGQMRVALVASDLQAVGESAHRLKGTAGYLGAADLARALGALQQRALAGDPVSMLAPLLDRVDATAAVARRRLEPLARD